MRENACGSSGSGGRTSHEEEAHLHQAHAVQWRGRCTEQRMRGDLARGSGSRVWHAGLAVGTGTVRGSGGAHVTRKCRSLQQANGKHWPITKIEPRTSTAKRSASTRNISRTPGGSTPSDPPATSTNIQLVISTMSSKNTVSGAMKPIDLEDMANN